MKLESLDNEPRLLLEGNLQPIQGTRFQPTGFPDLDAATYDYENTRMLLVESAQSMANRLEAVCWDSGEEELCTALKGLPYVRSTLPDGSITNSILEAHRLNSPYIYNSKEFTQIEKDIGFEKEKPLKLKSLFAACLKYDVNSLLHGLFLEKVAGVLRFPRSLTAFIEASEVQVASSGGVKIDRVQPVTSGDSTTYGKAKDGYGNVPFHRDEFTGKIKIFFNLDLAQIRGFGFEAPVEDLLLTLALYKIAAFLDRGLRLRTACDLELQGELTAKRPASFTMPSLKELEAEMPNLIKAASKYFAEPVITDVTYAKKSK